MAITVYFSWSFIKQLHNGFGISRKALTALFLQQGVIRFLIILIWNLENSISTRVLNLYSVSVILVCRFILHLRKFNTRVQTIPSVNIASSGIRGRLQHIHKTIIEEFGNSGMEYDLEMENDMAELEGDTTPSAGIDTEVHITAEEFPWAINPVENIAGTSEIGSRKRRVEEEV
ncbi:hypothetical protein M422DRAFT_259763 [Sphaerobolus stellatus SS14]|uniref:Uncharacterized protein n=1 Tax=Sphaerobolus stellatus (strain SS14) TaxID=990650 RepID=A0A0C9V7X5_SPHS4|nr:hypothetical protein M422DRAFT_259763 [Sphaerobolus stellatus SS14]